MITYSAGTGFIKENNLRKFYQSSWHGLKFSELGQSSTNLPTKRFYDRFYEKFFEKHENFEQLDKNWVNYKLNVAHQLNNILTGKSSILSIGCGIGFVENELARLNAELQITAIEPSKNALKWIIKNPRIRTCIGYFPECLDSKHNFDMVYANNIEYVFNDSQYAFFLNSVVRFGVSDFLIITTANYNSWVAFKGFLKDIIRYLFTRGNVDKGQLWGYLRSKKEHIKLLRDAGFNSITITKFEKNTLFIRARK